MASRYCHGLFGFVYKIATAPITIFYNVLFAILKPILSSAPPKIDSRVAVRDFLSEFRSQYGNVHPNIFTGSFREACNSAKSELRPLLVYLHSADHADTHRFLSETFRDPTFVEYVNANFIVWVGSVSNSEGFSVYQQLGAAGFPHIHVLAFINNKRHSLLKLEKLVSTQITLEKITGAGEVASAQLSLFRHERDERMANQRLREEQDQAYYESLKRDQEKERKKNEEKEALRLQEEMEKQKEIDELLKKQALQRKRAQDSESLPEEPAVGSKNICRMRIRLPSGKTLQRNFNETDLIMHVYHFIAGDLAKDEENEIEEFSLWSNMPKKHYGDQTATLKDAGLCPSAMLYVQDDDD